MNDSESLSANKATSPDPAEAFTNYFCCPREFAPFCISSQPSSAEGFFRFGDAVCFGRLSSGQTARTHLDKLFNAEATVAIRDGQVELGFNPTRVIDNLRQERYLAVETGELFFHSIYYALRPIFPVRLRQGLQQAVFRARRDDFPSWPVDCTVENIFAALMKLAIRATSAQEIPFIWFWPDGKEASVMLTHDVERQVGAEHCQMLMDLDQSFRLKAAFQVIPERRYTGVDKLVDNIRARGFEVNLHDLDHDGRLYENLRGFRERAHKINEHGRKYNMRGFRAGAMHRNQSWFELLDFDYEMSVPNVSHLEPQRGGCCTVMPYFVGNLLELPLTTVQDYAMFYILRERSIDLWKQQIEIISAHHGLISFILHPDYVVSERERNLCTELLSYLSQLREQRSLWIALPGEIDRWCRQRRQMQLVRQSGNWRIRGEGSGRARVAFARLEDGEVRYRLAGHDLASSRQGQPWATQNNESIH